MRMHRKRVNLWRLECLAACCKRSAITRAGSVLLARVAGSSSPQEQERASQSCWQELGRRDEVAADKDFGDFVNAGEEIVQLVFGAQEESEEANDPDTVEAPVPSPSQLTDAVDLLGRFSGAHEGVEHALTSQASYEKCVLTKGAQAKIASFVSRQ